MRIWSRASAAAATAITPARASGIALMMDFLSTILPPGHRSVIDCARHSSEPGRPVPTPLRSPYYYGNVKVLFQPAAKSCGLVTAGASSFTVSDLLAQDPKHQALLDATDEVWVCNTARHDYFGALVVQPDLILEDLRSAMHLGRVGPHRTFQLLSLP